MSETDDTTLSATDTTEIILTTGDRYRVHGNARSIERTILDAARGSIMELAWLIDADTRDELGVNPEHVILLRAAGPGGGG